MRKTLVAATLAALALTIPTALAQRGPGRGGPGNGGGTGTPPQVDVLHPVTIEGSVVGFTAGAGLGMPTLVVRDASAKETAFVLGSYRYLASKQFAAQLGDSVRVTAYPCESCPAELAVAQVVNVTRNLTLDLRAADGTPLFAGNGPGRGHGMCGAGHGMRGAGGGPGAGLCDGSGPDLTRAATFDGTARSFSGGPGVGRPTLVLTTTAGEKTILLAPFRLLAAAGFTPAEGMRLSVEAAPVTHDGTEEWVALSVKDLATGLVVVLRDPATGLPVGGRGPRGPSA